MRSNETINVYLGAVTLFYDFAHRARLTPTNLNEHVREAGRRTRYKDFLHAIAASEPRERDSLRQEQSRPARPKTIPKADVGRLIGVKGGVIVPYSACSTSRVSVSARLCPSGSR